MLAETPNVPNMFSDEDCWEAGDGRGGVAVGFFFDGVLEAVRGADDFRWEVFFFEVGCIMVFVVHSPYKTSAWHCGWFGDGGNVLNYPFRIDSKTWEKTYP